MATTPNRTTTRSTSDARRRLELIAAMAATLQVQGGADEPFMEGYDLATRDIPFDSFERAAQRALRECEFMPRPKEFRILAGMDVSPESRAILAFDVLTRLVAKESAYNTVCTDDPVLNVTISSLGGWPGVCETPSAEWESFFRQRFIKTYAANLECRRGTTQPQYGLHDRANLAAGYQTQQVRITATGLPKLQGVSERPALSSGDSVPIAAPIGNAANEYIAKIGLIK